MNILVIGRSGQLAVELMRATWPSGTYIQALGRERLDIADRDGIAAAVDEIEPDVIINAAAYTAVDRAEVESDMAFAVNQTGPRLLAKEAVRCGAPLIHVSTDYVFSGPNDDRPWREEDEPAPKSVYGLSKYLGERAIQEVGGQHIILRTSWLFAAHGQNFVKTMLRLGAERDTLSIVNDQRGCPTAVADLARVIAVIVTSLRLGDSRSGIYHYSGQGPVTWYEFAQQIFAQAGDLVPRLPALKPISTAEFNARAQRPVYSVLDSGKLEGDFAIAPAPWTDGLKSVLDEIRQAAGSPSVLPPPIATNAAAEAN